MRRWLCLRLGLCVLAALCAYPASAEITVGRLKCLFIERFTRFVEWPAGALPDDGSLLVCIAGTGETANSLFEFARTAKWKGRPGQVRWVHDSENLAGCHLLYVSPSEAPRLSHLLKAVGDKPVLTVSDAGGFAEQGVLINLYQEERLMKFEINLASVKRSGLVFSSQLLRLGRLVGEGAAPAHQAEPPGAR